LADRDRKRTLADRVELGTIEAAAAVAVPHAHVVRRGSEVGRGEVEMPVTIEVGRDDAARVAPRVDCPPMKGERLSDGERGAGEPNGERAHDVSHVFLPTSTQKEACHAFMPSFHHLLSHARIGLLEEETPGWI